MESDINIGTILNSVRKKKCEGRKKDKKKYMMLILGVGGNKFGEKKSTEA